MYTMRLTILKINPMLEYISPNKPIDSIARWHEIELGLKMYFEWDLEIYRSVHKSWHSNCILKDWNALINIALGYGNDN